MANIQAALNNMLSSAQAGAFIYTQTPEYKKRGEIKELTRVGKGYNENQKIYEEKAAELQAKKPFELPTDRDLTAEEEAAYKGWEKEYKNLQKEYGILGEEASGVARALLRKTGDTKYLETSNAAADIQEGTQTNIQTLDKQWQEYQAGVDERRAKEEFIQAEREAEQEMKSITTLGKKVDTHRNQKDALSVRLDLLSAKERGQLTTMYNRQQKKLTKEENK